MAPPVNAEASKATYAMKQMEGLESRQLYMERQVRWRSKSLSVNNG